MSVDLNMDFSIPQHIATADLTWQPSPSPTVWRKPLAREEAERGHATSVVRYDAGASFRRHEHPLGEEILVLQGVFSDETGDYSAGVYFRNPAGTGHAPFSHEGCLLFVKLHQFQKDDLTQLAVETGKADWRMQPAGYRELLLHTHGSERVSLVQLAAGQHVDLTPFDGGIECFLIEGNADFDGTTVNRHDWIRLPDSDGTLRATESATLWLKTGHLTRL